MKTEITLSPGGDKERKVPINRILVPDLWHLAIELKNQNDPRYKMVLDCWNLAHDLKKHILEYS